MANHSQQQQFGGNYGRNNGGIGAGTEISPNLEDDGLMDMLLADIAGDNDLLSSV